MQIGAQGAAEIATSAAEIATSAAEIGQLVLRTRPTVHRCEPSWSWQPGPMRDYDLWIVLAGHGTLRLNDRSYPLTAHRAFLLTPGDRVAGEQDPADRLRVFALHFDVVTQDGELGRLPADFTTALPPGHAVRDPAMLTALLQGCMASASARSALGDLRATGYLRLALLQLLAEAAEAPSTAADDRVRRQVAAVQEEPGRAWTVPAMARRAGLSRAQFTRRFTAITGLPPARFVIRARTDRAMTLLRDTAMPLAAIAAALGYADVFYFSRQFKATTGQPPSVWRESAAEEEPAALTARGD